MEFFKLPGFGFKKEAYVSISYALKLLAIDLAVFERHKLIGVGVVEDDSILSLLYLAF